MEQTALTAFAQQQSIELIASWCKREKDFWPKSATVQSGPRTVEMLKVKISTKYTRTLAKNILERE